MVELQPIKKFKPNSLCNHETYEGFGGIATCKQLSDRYGETPNFYNAGSSSLAKRVSEVTGCPILTKTMRTLNGGRFCIMADMLIKVLKVLMPEGVMS